MKSCWGFRLIVLLVLFSSCKAWKRDIILRFDEEFSAADLEQSIERASANYRINAGDFLQIDVFTNSGERLIDPNFELANEIRGNVQQSRQDLNYLVQANGTVKLPIIGLQKVDSLTIYEAEELLQEAFSEYYLDSFVRIQPTNRRVTVLGAFSSGGTVIPLPNENITILELLGLAGGLESGAEAATIKLIRGNINDPQVYAMDLRTISGMKKTGMVVEPGDVLYVEPWRRPFRQTLTDVAPFISLTTSLTTFILVISTRR